MIDLSRNFRRMKEEIDFEEMVIEDKMSFVTNPDNFWSVDILGLGEYKNKKCLKWGYISYIFDKVGVYWDEPKNYFNELQYNSFMHGNKWDSALPIEIKVGYGAEGIVSQIRDWGEGFDFEKIVSNFYNKKDYSSHRGRGFVRFNVGENYVVSWEGKGNIANFMFKPSNKRELGIWRDELIHQLLKT